MRRVGWWVLVGVGLLVVYYAATIMIVAAFGERGWGLAIAVPVLVALAAGVGKALAWLDARGQ